MKKKLITTAMAAMTIATIGLTTNINASTQDRPYNFHFIGGSAVTDRQIKEDSSSIYMHFMLGTATAYEAHAVGWKYGQLLETDCSSDPADPEKHYHYAFEKGQKRFMYNYVQERYCPLAGVRAEGISGQSASGVWSPDSTHEAGVIPATDYIIR